MQDQILQNILTRIDSVSTESALKDPVRFHPSLQPAVELFQILEDTSSTYGDELTEVYYERRAAERETGLSWQTSYRENIKEGLFSDGDIYYNRAFSTGLRWDLLEGGLLGSNQRARELKVREKIVNRSLEIARAGEVYEKRYNQIIYTFNIQKAVLAKQYADAAEFAFELIQRLHYLELAPWEDVLQTASLRTRADEHKLRTVHLYNEAVRAGAPEITQAIDEAEIFNLPLPELNIEEVLEGSRAGFEQLQIGSEDLQKLNYRPLTDISLSLSADYNIYDGIGRAFNPDDIGGREYFSVGVNLSVPLPLNVSAKSSMAEARQLRYLNDQKRESYSWQKELLNIYYDYRSKMQLFIESYKDYLVREEEIRRQRTFRYTGDSGYNIWRHSHAVLQRYEIALELLELQQQIYLNLIQFDRYLPESSILEYVRPVSVESLLPITTETPQNGIYIWSHSISEYPAELILQTVADYNINSVLISAGTDEEIHKKASVLIQKFNEAGLHTELMIGNNSLIQQDELPQNLEAIIALAGKLGVHAVHLDVEPHTFEDWRENREGYERDYIDMLRYIYPILQEQGISLSLSIPHFYDTILEEIKQYSDQVVVMVYETDQIDTITRRLSSEQRVFGSLLNTALRPVDFKNDKEFRKTLDTLQSVLPMNKIYIHDLNALLKTQTPER